MRDEGTNNMDLGNQIDAGPDAPLEMKEIYSKDKYDHKVSKETFGGVTEEASARLIGMRSPAMLSARSGHRGPSQVSQI